MFFSTTGANVINFTAVKHNFNKIGICINIQLVSVLWYRHVSYKYKYSTQPWRWYQNLILELSCSAHLHSFILVHSQ